MNKNKKSLGLILIAVAIGAAIFVFFGERRAVNKNNQNPVESIKQTKDMPTETNGLQITDEIIGTGAEAKAGDTVTVNYVGTLTDGKKFDSSYDRNEPFSFVLGAGQVIKGWDEGVAGMKVGGKRRLVIPPDLAYGNQSIGNGLIPANSTLIFEVELLAVKPPQG
ncbi:MAG TPA: FKBP-type peptidyl-prolyl cis-trans isomerase [Candidatus Tyrphobacter sp.]|nr:FKBP-type peptidyl-prolyl cis-trans isomerase [Candidatus Tyrphobacter sp.]